jgi:predicted kinase
VAGPLVLVCGLPGSGKSTLARALATRLGATYFASDAIRRELRLTGAYDDASIERVYQELLRRARLAANAGPVVLDATFASRRFREAAVAAATAIGAPCRIVCLHADEATALVRVGRARRDSEAGPAVYRLLERVFDPVTLPHLALDSSDTPVEALVSEVERYLRGAPGSVNPARD